MYFHATYAALFVALLSLLCACQSLEMPERPAGTETETETGFETETGSETESDDCSVTVCEEEQVCVERECEGDFQWCTHTGDGWEWSTSEVCGMGACPENTCHSNSRYDSYPATCTRYCNVEEAVCDECTCAPLETACTAGGCCVAACDAGTGCSTTNGACPDNCVATTLTTGRACTGCGANGADQTCSAGTSKTCSATNACETSGCGGTTYYCTNEGGTWAWSQSAACLGGTGTCQDGVCSSMTDCNGGKLDSETNLCWQDPPPDSTMNWYRASGTYHAEYNPDTENYCGALVQGGRSDWRLPNIDELISLIRGCQNRTATGDLSTSHCEMTPIGCVATDSCGNRTTCPDCSYGSGPASGCYWDPALGGTCGWYWSSSSYAGLSNYAWCVSFHGGLVVGGDKDFGYRVRCVRSGP